MGGISSLPSPALQGALTREQATRGAGGGERQWAAPPGALRPLPRAQHPARCRLQLRPLSCPSVGCRPAVSPAPPAESPPRLVPVVAFPGGRPLPGGQEGHGRGPDSEGARAAPRGGGCSSGGSGGRTWTGWAGRAPRLLPARPGASLPDRGIDVQEPTCGPRARPLPSTVPHPRDLSKVTQRASGSARTYPRPLHSQY